MILGNKRLRTQVALGLTGLLGFTALALRDYTRHDFVCYWASARLLASGHNPYDVTAIQQIERVLGYNEGGPAFIMRNPPWVLPLIAPLACFHLHLAILLWAWGMLTLAALSTLILTRDWEGNRTVSILFLPLLLCLWEGQTTTILLFAATAFLCYSVNRPLVSGLSLSLFIIKPHLLFIFWPVLLLDCVRHRVWRLAAGFAIGLTALSGISFWLDSHAWGEYWFAMNHQGIGSQLLPNLSAELRFLLFPHSPWAQMIPSLLGLIAALLWYVRTPDWNWPQQGPLLIAASVVLSPYSWTYDLVLLLPAVLTIPPTRRVRESLIVASLLTILPVEFTQAWASAPMAMSGMVWVAWYFSARLIASREATVVCEASIS